MTEEKPMIIAAKHLLAWCKCQHTGNAPNSAHKDGLQPGHGACKMCPCPIFSWTGYVKDKDVVP